MPRLSPSAAANSSGICTIDIVVPNSSQYWVVKQITADCAAAPFGSTLNMFLNDSLVTPMVPTGDAAGGDPPINLYVGDILRLRWTGLVAGTQAKLLVLYDEAKYT